MSGRLLSGLGRQGREFRITRHPLAQAAAREFSGGGEEGTLRFFDAVLPHCVRMVDFGAYVGFTALYAATWDADVFAFEPSPANHELLACNVAENPELAPRIRLFRHGVADGDGYAPLYAEAAAGSGSSVFRDVERRGAAARCWTRWCRYAMRAPCWRKSASINAPC